MDTQLIDEIKRDGVTDPDVLQALRAVPREAFVPEGYQSHANLNQPLPIGCGQTISQPYVVARMTALLIQNLARRERVLEVGTGSGYQAAILTQLFEHVYTIERHQALYQTAKAVLAKQGYQNVTCRHGDGYLGWGDEAPFDGIMVTAGATEVPEPLLLQLRVGGRLVIPVGEQYGTQELFVITRLTEEDYTREAYDPVVFVPLVHGTSDL